VEVQQLIHDAMRAMQTGRLDEAAQLWARVLAIAPEHPQALFHLGQHKLLQKDVTGALHLLEQAVKADPKNPAIHLNVAFAYRALGDPRTEIESLDRALAVEPYYLPALLAKAAALERVGRAKESARIYKDALSIAPSGEHLPQTLRTQLEHARSVVTKNAEQLERFIHSALAAVRLQHGGSRLHRFEMCKDALLGRKKIYAQQPTMSHYPELPAIQFYDKAEFPWLADLESNTDIIRGELLNLLQPAASDFKPYVRHPAGVPLNQWAELNESPNWSAYFLWEDGKRVDDNCARCPRTATILDRMPLANVPGYAPTAFFSILKPHTRIPPHTGVTNTRLIVHLPLIVPEKNTCFFRVGNETREFVESSSWIFDDTIEHEAWNDSEKLRAVLIFDIWNPYLDEAERDLVSALLGAVRRYYRSDI
jgi:aspartate beta-hydroxylase